MVIGIGGNSTYNVIDEICQTDLSSFGAILSVSPYYNKPSQEGIYQHFSEIANSSDLPLLFTMCHQEQEVQLIHQPLFVCVTIVKIFTP